MHRLHSAILRHAHLIGGRRRGHCSIIEAQYGDDLLVGAIVTVAPTSFDVPTLLLPLADLSRPRDIDRNSLDVLPFQNL